MKRLSPNEKIRHDWSERWAGILEVDGRMWTVDGRQKLTDAEIEATVALWRSWGIQCRSVRRSEVTS